MIKIVKQIDQAGQCQSCLKRDVATSHLSVSPNENFSTVIVLCDACLAELIDQGKAALWKTRIERLNDQIAELSNAEGSDGEAL